MYIQPLTKTMRNFIIVLVIAMLVIPFGVPSAWAKETATAKVVKVAEGHMGLPSALDDQGNLWATSVSSRAYRKNFFQYRANFVKMESMGKVLDISSRFVLKEDGTVWAIEYEESKEQDKDKWGLYTPSCCSSSRLGANCEHRGRRGQQRVGSGSRRPTMACGFAS